MNFKMLAARVVLAVGFAALSTAAANATPTFLEYHPVGSSANIGLSGTTLSASSAVAVSYLVPGLSSFGNLSATFTLTATETGAIPFGPVALATFDGSFALTYTGANVTLGSVTIHTGDDLLSGSFLGSVYDSYGSAGSIIDSTLGGGLVSFNDNSLLTFDPLQDEALALSMTSIDPPATVVSGELTPFTAVSSGTYAAVILTNSCGPNGELCHPTNVPEPVTLSLFGAGLVGAAALRRRKKKTA